MPASRARTTTVTKAMLNAMCAMVIVPRPSGNAQQHEADQQRDADQDLRASRSAGRAAPSSARRPRNLRRASASASRVPNTVATTVEMAPTMRLARSPRQQIGTAREATIPVEGEAGPAPPSSGRR